MEMQSKQVLCNKCIVKPAKVVNRNKPLCHQCFLNIIDHKFKSNLRTNCKIRHEDYTLVCISGDNNSMAMLNMFYKAFNESTSNRKLFFKLKVLYIDDSLFLKSKEAIISNRQHHHSYLKSLCDQYHFPIDILNLEYSLTIPQLDSASSSSSHTPIISNETNMDLINKYLTIYNMLDSNGGYKKKFNQIMTQNLIFYYALINQFSKVIYANSGQSLVSDIFSDIVSGRGNTIRDIVDYTDMHYLGEKVKILKPMKDFFTKEILLYNYINKVEVLYPAVNVYDNKGKGSGMSGMDSILNGFFTKLQKEKLNTVPSVINTAEKLVKNINDKPCRFCLNLIDKQCSKLVIGTISNNDDNTINNNSIYNRNDLCFGCKRMFNKFKGEVFDSLIPLFLIKRDSDNTNQINNSNTDKSIIK